GAGAGADGRGGRGAREAVVERVRSGQRAIAQHAGERVEGRVSSRDALESAGDDVVRAGLAGPDGGGDRERRGGRAAHDSPFGAGSTDSGSVNSSTRRAAVSSAARWRATAARNSGAIGKPIGAASRSTSASVRPVRSNPPVIAHAQIPHCGR